MARVRRWCRDRVPERARDQVRVEADVSGRDVTIVERRPPWSQTAGDDWTTIPVARLRYLTSRGVWRLYWRDRDERWHEYADLPFAATVDELLAELDSDPTALFWG
ncbi:DUF3024 domain-containing protein [Blastococcus haudaquaticus]